jgi:acetoin utilization deacetylase AcuC-like enzyme
MDYNDNKTASQLSDTRMPESSMTFPIVHADTYNLHNPAFEIWPGGRFRPYFETPQRAEIILEALRAMPWAKVVTPEEGRFESLPLLVHEGDYVWFIRNGFQEWLSTNPPLPEGYPPTYYPSSFPPPRARRKLKGEARLNAAEGYGYYTSILHGAADRRNLRSGAGSAGAP